MEPNPYATPDSLQTAENALSEVEETRRLHLRHERSIQSIGLLFYIGAAVLIAGACAFVVISWRDPNFEAIAFSATMLGCGIAFGFVGRGLRAFRPWARTMAIAFSCVGLLFIPIITAFSIASLITLFSPQNKVVFSPGYEAVIRATPHMKSPISKIAWLLLAILLGLGGYLVFVRTAGARLYGL